MLEAQDGIISELTEARTTRDRRAPALRGKALDHKACRNFRFGADSGPSRGNSCIPAIRPIEASKAAIRYVSYTSRRDVHFFPTMSALVDLTHSPSRQRRAAICAEQTSGVDVRTCMGRLASRLVLEHLISWPTARRPSPRPDLVGRYAEWPSRVAEGHCGATCP